MPGFRGFGALGKLNNRSNQNGVTSSSALKIIVLCRRLEPSHEIRDTIEESRRRPSALAARQRSSASVGSECLSARSRSATSPPTRPSRVHARAFTSHARSFQAASSASGHIFAQ